MARLRGKKEAEQLELWTGAAREKQGMEASPERQF